MNYSKHVIVEYMKNKPSNISEIICKLNILELMENVKHVKTSIILTKNLRAVFKTYVMNLLKYRQLVANVKLVSSTLMLIQ